jgi:uncharacterized membrane protein
MKIIIYKSLFRAAIILWTLGAILLFILPPKFKIYGLIIAVIGIILTIAMLDQNLKEQDRIDQLKIRELRKLVKSKFHK